MQSSDLEKALRARLRHNGTALKSLSAQAVLQTMIAFWTEIPAEDASEGDGVIVWWDLMSRSRGTNFEIGCNRMLCVPGEAGVEKFALRLSVGYACSLEVLQLEDVAGAKLCWDSRAAEAFLEEALALPSIAVVSGHTSRYSGISFEQRQGGAIPVGPDSRNVYHWGGH
ncbi:hypothetical protein ACFFGH_34405 [Lysobacter korlensis]|uniref:Uncharacterized protein n=1 Tax=Lysobacter korlensis TaxID=553636 RepID=A0ABV6S145_9GAMM